MASSLACARTVCSAFQAASLCFPSAALLAVSTSRWEADELRIRNNGATLERSPVFPFLDESTARKRRAGPSRSTSAVLLRLLPWSPLSQNIGRENGRAFPPLFVACPTGNRLACEGGGAWKKKPSGVRDKNPYSQKQRKKPSRFFKPRPPGHVPRQFPSPLVSHGSAE